MKPLFSVNNISRLRDKLEFSRLALHTVITRAISFIPVTLELRTVICFNFVQLFSLSVGRLVDYSVRAMLSLGYIHAASLKNPVVAAHSAVVGFLLPILLLDTSFSNYLGSSNKSGILLKAISRILTLAQHSIVRTTDGTSLDVSLMFDNHLVKQYIDNLITIITKWKIYIEQNPKLIKAS